MLEAFNNQDAILFKKWVGDLKKTSRKIQFMIDQITEPHLSVPATLQPGEQVDLREVLRDVLSMLSEEIRNDNVSIDTEFSHFNLKFPRKNLRSIIYNLLGNAIKYKNPNTDLVISLKTRRENHYFVLDVQDNGIGILKENQKSIFEKSARFNKNIEGTGMGLYIIKRMMENNGGKIEVESNFRKGSTFKLYFRE